MTLTTENIVSTDIVELHGSLNRDSEDWYSLICASMLKLGCREDVALSVAADFGTTEKLLMAKIDIVGRPVILMASSERHTAGDREYESGRLRLVTGTEKRGFTTTVLENWPIGDDTGQWWEGIRKRFLEMEEREGRGRMVLSLYLYLENEKR